MDNDKVKKVIYQLLDNLPDSNEIINGKDWEICWDALLEESQDNVKAARAAGLVLLKELGDAITDEDIEKCKNGDIHD